MTTRSFNNNLELCIEALSVLPLEEFVPIVLGSGAEQALWKIMKFAYKAKAAWLRVLMLMEPMPPALLETSMLFYKPHAEISKALASLATEVYLRAGDLPISIDFDSPAELWLACELSNCRIQLDTSGLTDSPLLIGKRDCFKRTSQVLDWTEAYLDGVSVNFPAEALIRSLRFSTTNQLNNAALALAKVCPQFNQSHYRPYLKAKRYWERQIQRCKDLQFCYYHPGSDQLIVTGKGKKLPPRK